MTEDQIKHMAEGMPAAAQRDDVFPLMQQDEDIEEALSDAVSDGEGRLRVDHVRAHLAARGYTIVRAHMGTSCRAPDDIDDMPQPLPAGVQAKLGALPRYTNDDGSQWVRAEQLDAVCEGRDPATA